VYILLVCFWQIGTCSSRVRLFHLSVAIFVEGLIHHALRWLVAWNVTKTTSLMHHLANIVRFTSSLNSCCNNYCFKNAPCLVSHQAPLLLGGQPLSMTGRSRLSMSRRPLPNSRFLVPRWSWTKSNPISETCFCLSFAHAAAYMIHYLACRINENSNTCVDCYLLCYLQDGHYAVANLW
jgi:hypothetical protein